MQWYQITFAEARDYQRLADDMHSRFFHCLVEEIERVRASGLYYVHNEFESHDINGPVYRNDEMGIHTSYWIGQTAKLITDLLISTNAPVNDDTIVLRVIGPVPPPIEEEEDDSIYGNLTPLD